MTVTPPPEDERSPSLVVSALLGLGLLLGFYVLALAVTVAILVVNIGLIRLGRLRIDVLFGSAVTMFGVLKGMLVLRGPSVVPDPGILVTDETYPSVERLVRDVATDLAVQPPDAIYVVPDVNAWAAEDSRLFGLVRGKRVIGIGVGLFSLLTLPEIRGVIAHEFGHFAGGETRLGRLTYHARESVRRTAESLGDTWIGKLFLRYLLLVLRVTLGIGRRQELRADRDAAALVGADRYASALRKIGPGAEAFDFYLRAYVAPCWERGLYPEDLYGGFRNVIAARPDEIDTVAREIELLTSDIYDSHPALAERLTHIEHVPSARTNGTKLSSGLRAEQQAAEAELGRAISVAATRGEAREPVAWEDFGDLVFEALAREDVRTVYEAVAVVDRGPRPANLGRFIDLLEQGRHNEVVHAMIADLDHVPTPERDEIASQALEDALNLAVSASAVDAGVARWEIDWACGPIVVPVKKNGFKPDGIASALVGDPSRAATAKRKLGRLGLLER
jgi:Zn-dependent protease with chaperone function